ncbi:Sister chromatid cohesion protein DCC1 [Araneus ventricosus]|uniref:Sister chromatid cohesion protein DCC1 n=1 Tax=Araneus ventricosus TaxID=182803 RepID=A0A4Y2KSC0_ARAVE|nr:Sister chromatid cohesion protein DCC1 [Araneus ventricosus]
MTEHGDLEYAKRKINLARLEESEISPVIQSLTLQEGQDDICLLQLNSEILSNISEGQVLTIRGDAGDSAVLCTKSSTYELKEAETSNSLLLLPGMFWPETCENGEMKVVPQTVNGVFHNYYELRAFKPSFKKLRSLLERKPYQGKEYEDPQDFQDKFTFEMLLDTIQASEEELKSELTLAQACLINGYVRFLDFDYKFSVFSCILDVMESRSMPLNKVLKEPIIEALEDLEPKEILEECFSWFTEETGETDENGHKLFALKEDSVCKLYAEVLLRSSGKFHLQDFLESWQRSVPEGMKCDLKQLRGLALTDLTSRPEVIFHFPSQNLPENIKERFEILFKVKEKWEYDEIVPYLEDRTYPGNDVKALLIKYTRESTKDGRKMYNSKW